MTPAERLERAEQKAERATRALEEAAVAWAKSRSHAGGPSVERENLIAAAKTCTNAWHEVGRCEKAVRDA